MEMHCSSQQPSASYLNLAGIIFQQHLFQHKKQ
ncbi:MAG: hypothetical protein ACI88A_002944 [Paraglaciecola sp.]